jgi:hypothetical protein
MIETKQLQELWNKRLRVEIWYSCVVISVLMAVAQLVSLEVDRHILGRPFLILRLPYLFVALACLIVLLRRREKLGVQAAQLTIMALTLALLPYIWLSQAAFAHSQNPWIPFYGFQVTALIVPMLRYGRGIRLNVFVVACLTIEAAALWRYFHLGSERLLLQSGYMWNILFTGLCAAILLIARYQYERTLRGFVELEARAATTEKTARMLLTLRDRANSPLQTLEIGLALLKRQQPESAISDALLSALKKLIDLHQMFHAAEFDWSQAEGLPDLERLKEEKQPVVRNKSVLVIDAVHRLVTGSTFFK